MSGCRLSDEDMVDMEALGKGEEFSLNNVARLREEAARLLQPPPPSAGRALASIDVFLPPKKAATPEWARLAAWQRAFCLRNVLSKSSCLTVIRIGNSVMRSRTRSRCAWSL